MTAAMQTFLIAAIITSATLVVLIYKLKHAVKPRVWEFILQFQLIIDMIVSAGVYSFTAPGTVTGLMTASVVGLTVSVVLGIEHKRMQRNAEVRSQIGA